MALNYYKKRQIYLLSVIIIIIIISSFVVMVNFYEKSPQSNVRRVGVEIENEIGRIESFCLNNNINNCDEYIEDYLDIYYSSNPQYDIYFRKDDFIYATKNFSNVNDYIIIIEQQINGNVFRYNK